MKMILFLPAIFLFFLEWYVIRRTTIKPYLPILITYLVALPIGLFFGLHLAGPSMLFIVWAWALCLLEDELKKYFKHRRMTEEERSRLKDL